jgi:hypothetical protein
MSRPANPRFSISRRWTPEQKERDPEDAPGQRYRLEFRAGPTAWRTYGTVPSLSRAKRSAEAYEGEMRAVDLRTKEVVKVWSGGREVPR